MKTFHEKIIRRDDGSRVRIGVALREFNYGHVQYKEEVHVCAKGKRAWVVTYNRDDYRYRRMSMEERDAYKLHCNRMVATEQEILMAKTELWESLRPGVNGEI